MFPIASFQNDIFSFVDFTAIFLKFWAPICIGNTLKSVSIAFILKSLIENSKILPFANFQADMCNFVEFKAIFLKFWTPFMWAVADPGGCYGCYSTSQNNFLYTNMTDLLLFNCCRYIKLRGITEILLWHQLCPKNALEKTLWVYFGVMVLGQRFTFIRWKSSWSILDLDFMAP